MQRFAIPSRSRRTSGDRRMRKKLVRRTSVIACVAFAAAVAVFPRKAEPLRRPNSAAAAVAVRALLMTGADSLDASLVALSTALRARSLDAASAHRTRIAFEHARERYKLVEGATEFYAPALAAAFNSRRQEVDDDDAPPPSTLAASGFPALESLLYPSLREANADSARRIVDGMRPLARRLRELVPALVPTDAQIIDLARLEIARVSTLGISGFDAPLTGDAMREGATALEGVRLLYGAAGGAYWPALSHERASLDAALTDAAAYLREHPDFDSFNRLAFISTHAARAATALDSLRRASGVTFAPVRRGWRADAPSVFSANAFDARAYAPSGTPAATPELIALGARLFTEPALSGNGARSCASCHRPDHGFTDGLTRATSIGAHGTRVARHTPTILSAGLQPAQFADERAATLEDQALLVLSNPVEMASSDVRAAVHLQTMPEYETLFAAAFGARGLAITPLRVRQALAAYERSLTTLDSRFDRAVRGDTSAMSAEERRGFTLFMGKAGCGTCHFAPLFSGVTPPLYMSSDVEVIGTPSSPRDARVLDPDSGRAGIDHLPAHLRAFKTPSLRNVAGSKPYMHNGAFRTLDDVIRFYDGGGALGAGARITNQTLAPDSLHLSASERSAIIAFIGSITSDKPAPPRPASH
jgi:cytochrome c peroxidase